MKSFLKMAARGIAAVLALPWLVSYFLRAPLLGRDRALEGSSQALSLIPGLPGVYVRAAFYSRVLESCHPGVVISFGVLFSKAGARVEQGAYIGPHSHLGLVHIERDVLLGPGVQIPSGSGTHSFTDLSTPVKGQPGTLVRVRVGAGSWIGASTVLMADVGRDSVIGAGAVVTRPIPDRVVAAGVPARVLKSRE